MWRDDDVVRRNIWCIYIEINLDDDDCFDDKFECFKFDCEGNYFDFCIKEFIINCFCDVCFKVEDVFCEDEVCMGVGEDKNFQGMCFVDNSFENCLCIWFFCLVLKVDLNDGSKEEWLYFLLCDICDGFFGVGIFDVFFCKWY